jgi:hypothetical protein
MSNNYRLLYSTIHKKSCKNTAFLRHKQKIYTAYLGLSQMSGKNLFIVEYSDRLLGLFPHKTIDFSY